MLLPNINTILNMDIQEINYPGFNRSLEELNEEGPLVLLSSPTEIYEFFRNL